jgi:hypothetical protein
MMWLILIVISTVISVVILTILGGLGGMILLLALNGFSESESTPIIGCYALFVLGLDLIPATLIDWWVVRRWFPQAGVPLWGLVVLNILVIVGLIAAVVGFIMLRRALS